MTYLIRYGSCHTCFGQTSLLPNLRRNSQAAMDSLASIVLAGALLALGMPFFAREGSDFEVLKPYLQAGHLD